MAYPADYGFIEGTLGGDGDPLDALVLVGEPTFPGCRIRVRVVGVFHMADEKGPDEKIICVPLKDPAWMRISDVHDIPAELRNEVEHFFQVYKDLREGKSEKYGTANGWTANWMLPKRRSAPKAGGPGPDGTARMIVFGAIAPHGDPAFHEGSPTRLAMEELGRRLERAEPDVVVVATPHNVHVEGAFAVVTSATIAGPVGFEAVRDELSCTVDRELASGVLDELRAVGLPAVGISFGGNDPTEA